MSGLRETVKRCLLTATALTNKKPEDITGEVLDAWTAQAERHGMDPEAFSAAFDLAMDTAKSFTGPVWGEVWAAHRSFQKALGGALVDPVIVSQERDVLTLGEKARCEAKGLPYVPLSEEGPKALPSPESRGDARARLDKALKKLGSKNRMSESRVRRGKDEAHDEGFKARRDAQVRDLAASEAEEA